MDFEPLEQSRERAVSPEPCSARPNPFDDQDSTSRKRQRTSRRGSRSLSPDTASPASSADSVQDPHPEAGSSQLFVFTPTTPTRKPAAVAPPKPNSSRVTLNIRADRPPESATSTSPGTPSKMASSMDEAENETRISIESGSDGPSAGAPIATPSSSSSVVETPELEINLAAENADGACDALIDEDGDDEDPMAGFPYRTSKLSNHEALRLGHTLFQGGSIESDEIFRKYREWMDRWMRITASDSNAWLRSVRDNEGFWLDFPNMIFSLSFRSRFFGEYLPKDGLDCAAKRSFQECLYAFARLAGRWVSISGNMFQNESGVGSLDNQTTQICKNFLNAYGFLLRKEEQNHIGRSLENFYRWNWDEEIQAFSRQFQVGGGSIENVTQHVEGLLKLVHTNQKVVEYMTEPCRLVGRMVMELMARRASLPVNPDAAENQQLESGYEFFQVMSSGLETIIDKYVTFLLPDAATVHLTFLANILFQYLALGYEPARRDYRYSEMLQRYPDLQGKLIPRMISMDWKFTMLTKLVMSAQMQLRVVGVTQLCGDLLNIYQNPRQRELTSDACLIHHATFIMQHKIIEYIVGVGSHPEIINESHNILGFLIATKTLKREQTDTIWQTIMTSRDPRVVEAILRMIKKCFNLYEYDSLLYICEKASELPQTSFTLPVREFCEVLFREMASKVRSSGKPIDAPPYDLCVRLIRESSISSSERPEGYPDVQHFASARLRELTQYGPDLAVKNAIYLSCIKDISMKTATAPGSVCVVSFLLERRTGPELRVLTTEHGLTKLVIEELEFAMEKDGDNFAIMNNMASQTRRQLISSIIIFDSQSITADLGTRLWNLLVGCQSKTESNRTAGWQILNTALTQMRPNNSFLAACFSEHLPKLSPIFYITGSLDFAREAVLTCLRDDLAKEQRTLESPALEQIWRMILTAPPDTIDEPAISFLVELYVEHNFILDLPKFDARTLHLALVDRCLNQLAKAAETLKHFKEGLHVVDDDSMVVAVSKSQFEEQEKVFARSLAVLREFVKAYHKKPQFSTQKLSSPLADLPSCPEGEDLVIRYQCFDAEKQTGVQSMTMGTLNTAAAFLAKLRMETGFQNYKVYYSGKEFCPDETQVSQSLGDLNIGRGLFLVIRREDVDGVLGGPFGNKSPLEIEITKHQHELWGYLGMHDAVAQEIFYFLEKFPVYERLLKDLEDDSFSYKEIFPADQPFKSLYAVHALRENVVAQNLKVGPSNDLVKDSVNTAPLMRAISLVVSALSDPDITDPRVSGFGHQLALRLVQTLTGFLKEPYLPTSVSIYLEVELLERLLNLLESAKEMNNSKALIWSTFAAILEASTQSPNFWKAFASHLKNSSLIEDLLLDTDEQSIRKNIMKQITEKCKFSSSLDPVSSLAFSMEIWPIVADLLPKAVQKPLHCEETMTLALSLFTRFAEANPAYDFNKIVRMWGGMLLKHSSQETVGLPGSVDLVSYGLASLLYSTTGFAKRSSQILSCSELGPKLFRKHLFPNWTAASWEDTDAYLAPEMPVLNTRTRSMIADIILSLIKHNQSRYMEVLDYMHELVPYDDRHCYVYDLGNQFDRSKSIRSPTGYVGLKNLSNTCYLNSLLTQMFMNSSFRGFMMSMKLANNESQRLLNETQRLFANMQHSFHKFADPAELAGSVRTYEGSDIDVTIQMDVDEFYNLIIDRWESQIEGPEQKRQFKSFYGGQLVQQVKSKECEHISERVEPFNAIQCEIKGKLDLEESLRAYVDGETMEGANKYKCSECDEFVDAVKRTCIKDIPDNLIFHLKRFDFNIRTMSRSKINDYFQFPNKIDMRPYTVQCIMGEETPEDVFELVGILVHSGNAESGHYYSFIRERPSREDEETWVEFNDENVSPWDQETMEHSCFGGMANVEGNLSSFEKQHSAYMLFYERSSVLASQKQALFRTTKACPIQMRVEPRLANHIAAQNEILLRKYCLYDQSHVPFVTKMLCHASSINKGLCSAEHELETKALNMALGHLDQVVSRTKDLPDFREFTSNLMQPCRNCAECSEDYLRWLQDCKLGARNLLMRHPDVAVRKYTRASILEALQKVRTDAPERYGIPTSDHESREAFPYGHVLRDSIDMLKDMWAIYHRNTKAWPQYFGLLYDIADMGDHEPAMILDFDFLRPTLDIVMADPNLTSDEQLRWIFERAKTKIPPWDAVIGLLDKLMLSCDGTLPPVGSKARRLQRSIEGKALPLKTYERELMMHQWTANEANILTLKLLHCNEYVSASIPASNSIITQLLHYPDPPDDSIFNAIVADLQRLSVGSMNARLTHVLRAALTYCEHSEKPRAIQAMVKEVAGQALEVDNSDGREFLYFFQEVVRLEDNFLNLSTDEIRRICAYWTPKWAPALLTYFDSNVRGEAQDLLTELLLSGDHDELSAADVNDRFPEETKLIQTFGEACLLYLNDKYIQRRDTAVRGHMTTIEFVLEECEKYFVDGDMSEFALKKAELFEELRRNMVEEADEGDSDPWEASDVEYNSSDAEAMEV